MIASGTVSIGSTATLITTASGTTKVQIFKTGGSGVKLGPSSVTFANGYTLTRVSGNDDTPLELTLSDGSSLYGICDTGNSATVEFIATN